MKYDFPKLDLHLHLDGSMNPELAWEMAKERGIEIPVETLEEFRDFMVVKEGTKDVNEYLARFEYPLQIMQDRDALVRTTKELVTRLASQGLVYAEIRFAPQLHTRKGLTQDEATDAVIEGAIQGMIEAKTINIGIICCAMSVGDLEVNREANLETVRVAKKYLDKGVVGVDLAGAECIVPIQEYHYIFDLAKELGVPFTCHAGDSDTADSVRKAMGFGAKRIGHGHKIFDDKELLKEAIKDEVAFEICPTSNIQCHTQPGFAEHPAKRMLDLGARVTINTDNMTLADTTVDDEYDHCLDEMGFEYKDLIKMNINSARASFMDEDKKEKLVRELEKKLAMYM